MAQHEIHLFCERHNDDCLSLQDCERRIKCPHCYRAGNGKKKKQKTTRIKSVTSFKQNSCNSNYSL